MSDYVGEYESEDGMFKLHVNPADTADTFTRDIADGEWQHESVFTRVDEDAAA